MPTVREEILSRNEMFIARYSKHNGVGAICGMPIERFERLVRVTPGCWIWTGLISPKGYGRFSIAEKQIPAHRFSYEAYCGEIPDGLFILHGCDNRKCVNPDHLRTGTNRDNMQDMVQRKRGAHQKSGYIPSGKLDEAQVRAICADRETHAKIGAKHEVSECAITAIKNRVTWRHLAIDPSEIYNSHRLTVDWDGRRKSIAAAIANHGAPMSARDIAIAIQEKWCFDKKPIHGAIYQVCRRFGMPREAGLYRND